MGAQITGAAADAKAQQAKAVKDMEAKFQTQDASVAQLKTDMDKVVKDSLAGLEAGIKSVQAAAGVTSGCSDGKKGGKETDVDCGGSVCPACPATKVCTTHTDCATGLCASGKCAACANDADCAAGLCFPKASVKSASTNVCGTCKSLFGHVQGDQKSASGFLFYCNAGQMGASSAMPAYTFTSCGKTGKAGPTASDMWPYARIRGMAALKMAYGGQHASRSDGGYQVLTAPVDGDYHWEVYGAAGGKDSQTVKSVRYHGGQGGMVSAIQKGVKKGTKFYIRAGQMGYDCITGDTTGSTGTSRDPCQSGTWVNGRRYNNQYNACGGFNGGGPAICRSNPGGSSGGGASDVSMCKNGAGCTAKLQYANRFLVAGGGGGSAAENNHWRHGTRSHLRYGGDGGAEVGERGYNFGKFSNYQGHREGTNFGYGGSQSAGGKVRNNENSGATPGALGQGGTGGENDAGGGGGGYYGGGGAGHNAGGGGGSNFVGGNSASGKLDVLANVRGHHATRNADGVIKLKIM